MAFDKVAQHVKALGGVQRTDGNALRPLGDDELRELSALVGGPLPEAFRWWLTTYGTDVEFAEPVVYDDDVLIGTFIGVDEIKQVKDDFEGSLAPQRLPFNDDASGNYLVIDRTGPVYWHIHDKPTDRNAERVADSFDKFLLMLRKGD